MTADDQARLIEALKRVCVLAPAQATNMLRRELHKHGWTLEEFVKEACRAEEYRRTLIRQNEVLQRINEKLDRVEKLVQDRPLYVVPSIRTRGAGSVFNHYHEEAVVETAARLRWREFAKVLRQAVARTCSAENRPEFWSFLGHVIATGYVPISMYQPIADWWAANRSPACDATLPPAPMGVEPRDA